MSAFVSVPWTTGDIITEVKLDNMVSNSQSEDAHAANGMIMNNNVAYRAKQAGGTTKDVMKLGTDDILRFSQLRYQKDDSESIASSTEENLLLQFGWGQVIGSGSVDTEEVVTFPTAFTTILFVNVSGLGGKTSAISNITDTSALSEEPNVQATDITTSGFTARLNSNDDSSNMINTRRFAYSWIAIGNKS